MGIFRCNKCGCMNEHDYESGMSEIACPKCTAPVKVYDTLFFVSKLLERYFSVNRELQALKQQEDGGEENVQQDTGSENQNYNPLAGVNLSETDILATEKQHEPLRRWFARANIVPMFNLQAVNMSGFLMRLPLNWAAIIRLLKICWVRLVGRMATTIQALVWMSAKCRKKTGRQ